MAGIGDYEEGKPFQLKSGNKTSFKQIGSSPVQDNMGDWEHTGMVQHREDGSHAGEPPTKQKDPWFTQSEKQKRKKMKEFAKKHGVGYLKRKRFKEEYEKREDGFWPA